MATSALPGQNAPRPPPRRSLPFCPSPEQACSMANFQRNHVSTYLFRVHTPQSAGITTTSRITTPAHKCCPHTAERDLFSLEPSQAAEQLNAHLRFQPDHADLCNLTSWTSSLLCAIQYGMFLYRRADQRARAGKDGKRARKALRLTDIKLLVVRSYGFPKGTFAKDAELAEVFAPHLRTTTAVNSRSKPSADSEPSYALYEILRARNNTSSAFGEYLSQGTLDISGSSTETSLGALIDEGLFSLCPSMSSDIMPVLVSGLSGWRTWQERVLTLRQPFFRAGFTKSGPGSGPPLDSGSSHAILPTTSGRETGVAWRLGRNCFGGWTWTVPMALMFLALVPRRRRDANVSLAFGNSAFVNFRYLKQIRVDSGRCPELEMFKVLVAEVFKLYFPQDITYLIEPSVEMVFV